MFGRPGNQRMWFLLSPHGYWLRIAKDIADMSVNMRLVSLAGDHVQRELTAGEKLTDCCPWTATEVLIIMIL